MKEIPFSGTFGQPDPWDMFDKTTFQHPMVPYDVLIDPQSLPQHPVLESKDSVGMESDQQEQVTEIQAAARNSH